MKYIRCNVENMMVCIASLCVSIIFLFKSPLHPWIGGEAGTDSSVFKTVALMMKMGYMPYKDSFDHKGPFLFILNYLGNSISYYRGIWIIEVIFLAVTVYYIYKIVRLNCSIFSSYVVTMISISLLFIYFEGGNFTEEYAMPFISVAIYVFADYFLNERISFLRIVYTGFGLGAVALLRCNMIAVWIVFCTLVVAKLVVSKEYEKIGKYTLFFMIGVGAIVIPIVLWLLLNNDFSSFWHDYIVFNVLYSSQEKISSLSKWSAFIYFANSMVGISALVILLFHVKENARKSFHLGYIGYMFVTFFFRRLY